MKYPNVIINPKIIIDVCLQLSWYVVSLWMPEKMKFLSKSTDNAYEFNTAVVIFNTFN